MMMNVTCLVVRVTVVRWRCASNCCQVEVC